MTDIRYICISDMHFGAYNSLLTQTDERGFPDHRSDSLVLVHLLKIIEDVISKVNREKKARFILNGDIFELALANTNEAVMSFDSFLRLCFTKSRKEMFSDRLIFIPGNHDHHLWETARERQYLDYMTKFEPGRFINPPWHHTRMIKPRPLKSRFISTMMKRHRMLRSGRALTVYPNLCLVSEDTEKYTVISHGHFIESMYFLMSRLSSVLLNSEAFPRTIDEIEKENFAWIDFFWSVLGRSGNAGARVGVIYDMLQDEKGIQRLSANLINYVMKSDNSPVSIQNIVKPAVNFLLTKIITGIAVNERGLTDDLLGKDALKGLYSYIKGPLRLQFIEENNGVLPNNMDFIFGHTHKPFAGLYEGFSDSGYPEQLAVYNTGGWVADTVIPQRQAGGAVSFIDEDLNIVLMRLYNEKNFEIRFESCNEEDNPFLKNLKQGLILNHHYIIISAGQSRKRLKRREASFEPGYSRTDFRNIKGLTGGSVMKTHLHKVHKVSWMI